MTFPWRERHLPPIWDVLIRNLTWRLRVAEVHERERIEQELQVARQIQQASCPRRCPNLRLAPGSILQASSRGRWRLLWTLLTRRAKCLFAGNYPVGAVGLEPTLLLRTRILSPVRLPIPPRPQDSVGSITASHPHPPHCSSGLPGRDGRGAGRSIRRRGSGWRPRCGGP